MTKRTATSNVALSVVQGKAEQDRERSAYSELIRSWIRHLRASNKSPRTIETYEESAEQFGDFLKSQAMPLDPTKITRRHVNAFTTHLLETRSASTASVRYRALQQFFAWLVSEEELSADGNPMKGLEPPKVPEKLIPVVKPDDFAKLLRHVERNTDFESKRDAAILLMMYDTGARRAEIANLRYGQTEDEPNDVLLDQCQVIVMGKGRKPRVLKLGNRAMKALDRYLRVRARHAHASEPWLWLSVRDREGSARLTATGIFQMIRRRAKAAGLGHLHPHQLRHSYISASLANGVEEHDLMRLVGWTSTQLLNRYGAITQTERALAHKYSPADNL